MRPMATLSIITVTYNAGVFLERTLQSLERCLLANPASRKEIEYLLIDGGSADDTLKIAQKYPQLINRVTSEKDAGLYDAMNKGQAQATGDYVWFLNAGDEIHDPQTLTRLLDKIRQNDADVLYSDALVVNNAGTRLGLRSQLMPHSLPKNITWRDFAWGMKICHQAFIAKRSICPKYDITNLSADLGWEINCLKRAQDIVYLDFVLCKYLAGGLSAKRRWRSLADRFLVLKQHFGLLPTLLNHGWIVVRAVLHSINTKLKLEMPIEPTKQP